MKKILSLLLALCLLPTMSLTVPAEEEGDPHKYGVVVVDEDFEDSKLNAPPGEEWVADSYNKEIGVYADVDTDPLDAKNKALKIVKDSGGLQWINRTFEPIGGTVTITYRAMITAFDVVHYVGYMQGIQNLMTYQGGWVWGTYTVPNISPAEDVWHDIKWIIDFNEGSYQGYINGVLTREIEINAELESLSKIGFGFADSPTWIDDLKISYEGGITTNYTKFTMNDSEYVYTNSLKGIYNIEQNIEPADFLNKFEFVEGALVGIYEADEVTPYTGKFIKDFTVLKIQAPDFTRELKITLHTKGWSASLNTVKASYNCVTFYDGDADMLVKNDKVDIDAANNTVSPYTSNNRLFVPLRALAESFGMTVGWEAATGSVTVNGVKVDCPKENKGGRTFIAAEDASRIINKNLLVNQDGIATFAKDGVELEEYEFGSFVTEIAKRKTSIGIGVAE